MKHVTGLLVGLVIAAGSNAYADCAADLAKLEGSKSSQPAEGISKDGSVAPLQESAASAANLNAEADDANATQSGNGITKNASTAPLEPPGSEDTQTAMSSQIVQAQQQGEQSAAGEAELESGADGRAAAMKEARAALDKGDEAACAAALQKAEAS